MLKKSLILASVFCIVAMTSFAQRPSETGKWISYTEGGVLYGSPDNESKAPFIFHSSLNYAFHRNLSAGIGAGFEFMKETYLPVTANVLYQFGNKKVSTPFVRFQAGYQVPLESNTFMPDYTYYYNAFSSYYPGYYPSVSSVQLDSKGGFMAHPSVGVIVYNSTGLGISLSAGYRYQQLTYQGANDYTLHIQYNRLSLTLGIIF
ncbi:MAG: hypothetical protein LBS46_01215 [Dysgonamonadaceae bacterium]|jgi:hypothetical protein|nr:hypothetical protein [Dysgonamonadaceae bacterium]